MKQPADKNPQQFSTNNLMAKINRIRRCSIASWMICDFFNLGVKGVTGEQITSALIPLGLEAWELLTKKARTSQRIIICGKTSH